MLIVVLVLAYIVVFIVLEALVLALFRINGFGKSLWQSAVVNLASLAMVYLVWPLISSMDIDEDKVFPLLPILFLMNLLTEGTLLLLLNKRASWRRVMLAVAVMNAVSYACLYLLFSFL